MTRIRLLPVFAALCLAGAVASEARADGPFPRAIDAALDLQRIAVGDRGRYETEAFAASLHTITQDIAGAYPHWLAARAVARSPFERMYAQMMLADNRTVAGDYDAAIAAATQLSHLAADRHHAGFRAQASLYLGGLARRRGQLTEAYAHHQDALRIARDANRPAESATALVNLGTVLRDMGRFSEAMDHLLQALDIRRSLGKGHRMDIPLRGIGLLYREIEDTQSAREYLEQAIQAAHDEYDPAALPAALGAYATLLNDLGESRIALDTARRALDIDSRLGNRQGIALEHLESARARIALKQWPEATAEVESAVQLGEAMRQSDVLGRALLYRGDLYAGEGQFAQAESAYARSLEYLTRAKLKPQLHAAYKAMEELLEARGDLRDALTYARKRAALREELLGITATRRLAVLELKQERERADRQVEMLRLDNSLKALSLRTETFRRRIGIGFIVMLLALLGVVFWRLNDARRTARLLSRKNSEISEQDAALRAANARLTAQANDLYRAATTDPLTQLSNRGHVMQQMIDHFDRLKPQGTPMSLLLIDLDRFKPINDTLGHQFGDRVLIAAARVLREEVADGAPLGRYGGEEFVAALPGIPSADAWTIAERLRLAVQRRLGTFEGQPIELTTSIGIAELHEIRAPSLSALIAAADESLYRAKALGRNRIDIAHSPPERRKPA